MAAPDASAPIAAPTEFPLAPGTYGADRPTAAWVHQTPVEVPDISNALTPEQELLLRGRGTSFGGNNDVYAIRELTPEDVASITGKPLVRTESRIQSTLTIRTTHHQVAQMLAAGAPIPEIMLITGYSQGRISILQDDPAFAELVAYYRVGAAQGMVDALEQLRSTGMVANEVLRERLLDTPGQFANRELVEIIKATVVDPSVNAKKLAGLGGVVPGGTNISISFVTPSAGQGAIIDVQS